MDGIRIGDFEETHLAEFAERLSLSEELSEVEAGSEILQVEACDQTSFSLFDIEYMDGMSLSEELSEVEAGSEILQVEACDQTFFFLSDSSFFKKPDPFKTRLKPVLV